MITPLTLDPLTDADWARMSLLGRFAFGDIEPDETLAVWRSLVADGAAVVVGSDTDDAFVGQSLYLDFELTVPGGEVLPAAGISFVAVAPTHRRRGVLRAMYTQLHDLIAEANYPLAVLTASEGGIYGRFGYGVATIEQQVSVDRRSAQFHPAAPDPGGVRMVEPAAHRDDIADIYDRWRRRTPGGLVRPAALLDDMLADRPESRRGGSEWFAFLHQDGYALYRADSRDGRKVARVEELTAVTADAHAALWRALLGLDLFDRVTIGTHPHDPLPYLLTDPRLAQVTFSADDLWVRIMDVPAALEARRYQGDLDVVLDVADGFRSDGGRFALQISGGRARCTPTDAPADIELDLDVLGSLYLGAHRIDGFAAANRLRCKDSEQLQRFGAAFVSDVPAELGFGF
ncbi:enhanced intracellular survival protein Eis [Mycolicibacterium goodii]|uniref:enhanced intracellular survival protein Eis n=1 Tax=Mycolicibacterium goodii TaxID=134601 RepID=UPI000C269E79|nr:enhanced intracellular survival protein Eis [Mycolicibacterium goodii]MBU8818692.1 enhanced intracellular survival protein Eis [Mycolicibacterium goodii]MBU8833719.1 enhanced intracellular survival protein Eis [Mycolicibacterium goodii]PJK18495.1 enhanced intracellular survival protein Eis [Mycolicibacterium goodii]ULN45049.1 enhanced intracellular survival protein Eis [Mycolicibacterium goodii]